MSILRIESAIDRTDSVTIITKEMNQNVDQKLNLVWCQYSITYGTLRERVIYTNVTIWMPIDIEIL